MTIVDVNVKTIDHSARYLYPNRTIEIKTKGRTIVTPIRAATSYEYREKAKVPTDIPINNPISINVENLSYTRFEKLLKTNHYFGKLLKRIDWTNRLAQYSDLRAVLLQPTRSPKIDPKTREKIRESPMELIQSDSSLREKFLRFIIKLQSEIGIDPITIPYLELPFHTFSDVATAIHKSLERIDRQPLFFVDIGYNDFELAIDLIANKLESKMIGLIFRRYNSFPLSYEVLSEYVDKDVAFFTVQISRYDHYYYDISTMHYLPFFGNDLYAVKTPSPFAPKEGDRAKPPIDRLSYVRFFDRESLRVTPLTLSPSIVDKVAEEYKSDSIISDILENYREASTNEDKYKVLRAFSKMHELDSSLSEFEKLQDYIEQSSTRDYIEDKATLQRTLHHARRYSVKEKGKQTRLANISH